MARHMPALPVVAVSLGGAIFAAACLGPTPPTADDAFPLRTATTLVAPTSHQASPLAIVFLLYPAKQRELEAELEVAEAAVRLTAGPDESLVVDIVGDAAGSMTYTVQRGDTLSGICEARGVGLHACEASNPQFGPLAHPPRDPNLIYPGERVFIPGGRATIGLAAGQSAAQTVPSIPSPSPRPTPSPTPSRPDGLTQFQRAENQQSYNAAMDLHNSDMRSFAPEPSHALAAAKETDDKNVRSWLTDTFHQIQASYSSSGVQTQLQQMGEPHLAPAIAEAVNTVSQLKGDRVIVLIGTGADEPPAPPQNANGGLAGLKIIVANLDDSRRTQLWRDLWAPTGANLRVLTTDSTRIALAAAIRN